VREDGGARSQGGPPVTGSRVFCSGVVSAPPLARARRSRGARRRDRRAMSNDRDDARGHRRIQVREHSDAGPPVTDNRVSSGSRFRAARASTTFAICASSRSAVPCLTIVTMLVDIGEFKCTNIPTPARSPVASCQRCSLDSIACAFPWSVRAPVLPNPKPNLNPKPERLARRQCL